MHSAGVQFNSQRGIESVASRILCLPHCLVCGCVTWWNSEINSKLCANSRGEEEDRKEGRKKGRIEDMYVAEK